MAHNHDMHQHGAHHETKNIRAAFFLNLLFTIIEIIGGLLTNSIAILSDALHDLGDSLTLGLSWYFQKIANRNPTEKYTFGYSRFSLLGALVNAVVLLVGSVFIIINAIPRIYNPEPVNETGMMWLAILGIVVNGAAMMKLKKGTSLNERVVSLHFMEDVLGWVAVLIASIIMMFWEVPWLDPILSLFIAAYILFNVYRNLKSSLRIVLQGSPLESSTDEIQDKIEDVLENGSIRDFHLWSLDGEYHICTVHIKLDSGFSAERQEQLKCDIRDVLEVYTIKHCTIEFQLGDEGCDLDS
jgi:cobalt-zinc-cadmium efflux system protein